MNLMKMIIVMFLHFVNVFTLLYQLSTKDLLAKVLSDSPKEGAVCPLSKEIKARRDYSTTTSKIRSSIKY